MSRALPIQRRVDQLVPAAEERLHSVQIRPTLRAAGVVPTGIRPGRGVRHVSPSSIQRRRQKFRAEPERPLSLLCSLAPQIAICEGQGRLKRECRARDAR